MIPCNSLQNWKCSPRPSLETPMCCGSDTSALFCCFFTGAPRSNSSFLIQFLPGLSSKWCPAWSSQNTCGFQRASCCPAWVWMNTDIPRPLQMHLSSFSYHHFSNTGSNRHYSQDGKRRADLDFGVVFFLFVLLLYKKRQSNQWEIISGSKHGKCLRLQGTRGETKQEILRAPALTLSLCVRAATPLAWIIAMKMGMSPKGLPFPPAMLTPSASFGPWNKAKPNTCSWGNSCSIPCSGYGNNWLLWFVEQGENGFDTHISSPKAQAHIQHPTSNTNNAVWLVRNAAKMNNFTGRSRLYEWIENNSLTLVISTVLRPISAPPNKETNN